MKKKVKITDTIFAAIALILLVLYIGFIKEKWVLYLMFACIAIVVVSTIIGEFKADKKENDKGLLIVFSGPSGVGKGTILEKLMEDKSLNLAYSVSMTTRSPREGEVNGVNYFFVSNEEFEKNIEEDKLLEHAKFVDHYYGTPRDYVEKMRNEGKNVILEIEVQGAKQVIQNSGDSLSIFIMPPDFVELENRIKNRGTEDPETIKKRIKAAKREVEAKDMYDYIVVNDDLDEAVNKVRDIIIDHMN